MFKRICILLTIFCLWFNFYHKDNIVQRVPTKTYRYTIPDLVANESIENFVRDSLGQTPPLKAPFIKIKFAPLHPRIGGLTTEVEEGVYFIQINSIYPLLSARRILFHELVHVLQFERGWLKEYPAGIVYWQGQLYTWALPWNQRPWEVQAEEYTAKLFKN